MNELCVSIRWAGRAVLALCLGLVWAASAEAAQAGTDGPTPGELEFAFSAGEPYGWTFVPGSLEATRRLSAAPGTSWDLRRCGPLNVQVRLRQAVRQSVRLRWCVGSRLGFYTAASASPVPASGLPVQVVLPLAAEAGALRPEGHQRPWDALAAAEVVTLELRAEVSGDPQPVTLEMQSPRCPQTLPTPNPGAILLDLRLEPAPHGVAAAADLSFRMDPLPSDPFAVGGEGDVMVWLPDGTGALAFFDQTCFAVGDGSAVRMVSAGAPRYRAHLVRMPEQGPLRITSGAREWSVDVSCLQGLAVSVEFPASDARRPRWTPALEVSLTGTGAGYADEPLGGAVAAWKLATTGDPQRRIWEFCEPAPPARAWRPVLFWNAQWGQFGGTRRPDFALARRLDEALAAAAARGQRQPLLLLDGEMYSRHGCFNWLSHPLNLAQGGRLSGPGELLRTQEGLQWALRTARYAVARWGRAQAVSGFLVSLGINTPGVSEFHAQLAQHLARWPEIAGKPCVSLHPLAVEPPTVVEVGGVQSRVFTPGGKWGPGPPNPSQIQVVPLDTRGGAASGRALEVTSTGRSASVCAMKRYVSSPAVRWGEHWPDDFFEADALLFDVWIPADAGADLRAGVHVRDRDGLWFQALLPGLLSPGDWTTCLLDLTARNTHGLAAVNHEKPWTDYSRQRLSEIGLHVYTTHPDRTLTARFTSVRGVRFRAGGAAPARIELAEPPPQDVQVGEKWECHLRLSRAYANPFNPCQVDLTARVTAPSGKTWQVPAFFDQPCVRRERGPKKEEVVDPVGAERWTVRYRVTEEGPHRVAFELREGGKYEVAARRWIGDARFSAEGEPYRPFIHGGDENWVFNYDDTSYEGRRAVESVRFRPGPVAARLALGEPAFTAAGAAAHWHGFVRCDADGRHFRCDDGSFYYALGPCLRSPSDSRLPYDDPRWDDDELDRLSKRGTYQYDDYLAAFEKAGVNWTRIWMCSWWGGLQWRRDWPGYQGLGRYNLLNAWRMDHVLDEAERRGVRVSLCLTNHGQFSPVIDTEWAHNPYNQALGGPLATAKEFFTRAEAKLLHQNMLRYVAARYGHSPAVLAWDLFSELEFTEEYRTSLAPAQMGRPDLPAPNIEAWHAETAEFLKSVDPWQHPVATHFSHPYRGAGTLRLPEIDIATSNAYSAFEELAHGGCDAAAALADFWDGSTFGQEVFKGFQIFKKPALVEEQGRHWMGVDNRPGRHAVHNTRAQLDADLHAGLWGSLMQPLAGATGYWWWLHVHFDDRYGEYRALANFLAGEDLRAAAGEDTLEPLGPGKLVVRPVDAGLIVRALKSNQRAYLWVYHRNLPLLLHGLPEVQGARVHVPGLRAGSYSVEFWDTRTGRAVGRLTAVVPAAGGVLDIPLVAVAGDVALKVKPRAGPPPARVPAPRSK